MISVFVIVVILLAVFFSMGYIVGRNSGPIASSEAARNGSGKAIIVERPSTASQPAPSNAAANPAQEPSAAPAETKPAAEATTTHPAQPAAVPAKPSPSPKPAEPPKPQPSAPVARVTGEPAPGDYWQVVATSRPDAEIISEALNKKGFHALVAPGPREAIFRVLVGPMKDSAASAQTRADLEASGFKNPIMRKY